MRKQATRMSYRIVGPGGELGEGTGASEAEALLSLYEQAREDEEFAARVNGVTLAPGGKMLAFTGKGPFPPNVDSVTFERVA
jgi:hypothetical protein